MVKKIGNIVYTSMEKKKSCNNCQDQPICEMNNTLKETACSSWHPDLEEYQKRWEAAIQYIRERQNQQNTAAAEQDPG